MFSFIFEKNIHLMNKNFNYIFVLSMPRSGSTLLRVLLGNIEGCVSLPETFFFVFCTNHKHLDISNKSDREVFINNWIDYYTTKRIINNLEELKAKLFSDVINLKDVLDITVLQYIKENNIKDVKYIIEKSPPHIFFQDDIKSLFPSSKAIYLLRDPRSVAGSMLNKPWSTHNIYGIARSWRKSTRLLNKIKPNVVVRYEDLVNRDELTYRNVADFLDSKISLNQFYDNQNNANQKGINSDYHTNLSKPIDNRHIDKWRVQLSKTDREQEIIEHMCKSEMLNYNYSIELKKRGYLFWLLLLLGKIKFLVLKFGK